MALFPDELAAEAERLLDRARREGVRIVTAESCTGGLVAGLLTEIAGSSDVVERGYVTYSNAAKSGALGVAPALIEAHGAVSEPVAVAMADGALTASQAELAVAITGVAGPGGGSVGDKRAGGCRLIAPPPTKLDCAPRPRADARDAGRRPFLDIDRLC